MTGVQLIFAEQNVDFPKVILELPKIDSKSIVEFATPKDQGFYKISFRHAEQGKLWVEHQEAAVAYYDKIKGWGLPVFEDGKIASLFHRGAVITNFNKV